MGNTMPMPESRRRMFHRNPNPNRNRDARGHASLR